MQRESPNKAGQQVYSNGNAVPVLDSATTGAGLLSNRAGTGMTSNGTPYSLPSNKDGTRRHASLKTPDRHMQVLEENRGLLVQNVITSPEFFERLRDLRVLPESMLKTVQETAGREQRNAVLLDLVKILGCKVFQRFCNVLDLTGHRFLADHLREEEARDWMDLSGSFQDLFKKFPGVKTALTVGERIQLVSYLQEKFSELSIQQSWKKASGEKRRLAEERNKILEDGQLKDRTIREHQREVASLQETIQEEQNLSKERQSQITRLKHELETSKSNHGSEMQKLVAANDASERSNITTHHRVAMFDKQIKALNIRILQHFGADEYAARSDANNVKVSLLEQNVSRLFDHITSLTQELQDLKDCRKKERKMVFDAMRIKDRGQHLKTAYFQSISSMENVIKLFAGDVSKLAKAFTLNEPSPVLGGSGGILDVDGDPEKLDQQLEERMNSLRNGFGILRVSLEKMVARVQGHQEETKGKDQKIAELRQKVETIKFSQQQLAKVAQVQASSAADWLKTGEKLTKARQLPPVGGKVVQKSSHPEGGTLDVPKSAAEGGNQTTRHRHGPNQHLEETKRLLDQHGTGSPEKTSSHIPHVAPSLSVQKSATGQLSIQSTPVQAKPLGQGRRNSRTGPGKNGKGPKNGTATGHLF